MRALRIAAVAATTVGAFALFLTRSHPDRLVSGLASLPLSSILAAVAATTAGVVLGASRWRSLLAAGGTEAPTTRLFAAMTIGAAVNNLVPARGGDAVRVESAHQLTDAPRLAIFRQPGVAAVAVVTTSGIWLADVVMYGALARGFHLDVSFAALLLLVGAGNLALAVPGAAAGLGSFELLTLASAHAIGLGGAELAAFVLAVHAVIILPTTVVGLVLARVALPRAFRYTQVPGSRVTG